MKHIFITAIGTDSGKTFVSSLFCEALGYNYWKPIQCGYPTDSETVRNLIVNKEIQIYNETYLLELPASPNIAANNEEVEISLSVLINDFNSIYKPTIIEGAGGILVPINDTECLIDFIQKIKTPVVVVSNFYLGSINHTLLSINELKRRNVEILGIVFNGVDSQNTKEIILKLSGLKEILHLEREKEINQEIIQKYVERIRSQFS